jgi:hypothetical protein
VTDSPLKGLPIEPVIIPDGVEAFAAPGSIAQWPEIVEDFEAKPGDFGHAFLYLAHHPIFWELRQGTDVEWYLVPGTAWYRSIEMGVWREANADKPMVWLEVVPQRWHTDPDVSQVFQVNPNHVEQLSVLADTFEQAITSLAKTVHKTWGNGRDSLKLPEEDPEGRWYG